MFENTIFPPKWVILLRNREYPKNYNSYSANPKIVLGSLWIALTMVCCNFKWVWYLVRIKWALNKKWLFFKKIIIALNCLSGKYSKKPKTPPYFSCQDAPKHISGDFEKYAWRFDLGWGYPASRPDPGSIFQIDFVMRYIVWQCVQIQKIGWESKPNWENLCILRKPKLHPHYSLVTSKSLTK